jgi:hypothetical protein
MCFSEDSTTNIGLGWKCFPEAMNTQPHFCPNLVKTFSDWIIPSLGALFGLLHWHLWKVDCSRHISSKKHFNNSSASRGWNYKTSQEGWVNKQSTKTRQVGRVNVSPLSANIFSAATKRSNIHIKIGSTPN